MNEKLKKSKNISVLIALSLITFAVATVGSTFSFFTTYIRSNENAGVIDLETPVDIVVSYQGTNLIEDEIYPGWEGEMNLTLTNLTTAQNIPASYSLNWEIITNEITNDELVYTVECNGVSNEKSVPEGELNQPINKLVYTKVPSISSGIGNAIINSGVTHECTIKLKFLETGLNQNHNIDKTFSARVIALGRTLENE